MTSERYQKESFLKKTLWLLICITVLRWSNLSELFLNPLFFLSHFFLKLYLHQTFYHILSFISIARSLKLKQCPIDRHQIISRLRSFLKRDIWLWPHIYFHRNKAISGSSIGGFLSVGCWAINTLVCNFWLSKFPLLLSINLSLQTVSFWYKFLLL